MGPIEKNMSPVGLKTTHSAAFSDQLIAVWISIRGSFILYPPV